jgi:hypothetical protein
VHVCFVYKLRDFANINVYAVQVYSIGTLRDQKRLVACEQGCH